MPELKPVFLAADEDFAVLYQPAADSGADGNQKPGRAATKCAAVVLRKRRRICVVLHINGHAGKPFFNKFAEREIMIIEVVRVDHHATIIVDTAGNGESNCVDLLRLEVVFCNQSANQRLNCCDGVHRIARMWKRKRFFTDELVFLANDTRRDLASANINANAVHAIPPENHSGKSGHYNLRIFCSINTATPSSSQAGTMKSATARTSGAPSATQAPTPAHSIIS